MIWWQGAISFLLWLAYGAYQSRRSAAIRKQVAAMSRTARGVLGAALFLVGAMVLIGGLAIILHLGGFGESGMTGGAWPAVTLLGLAFVHAQTMGTAMLVTLVQENVTKSRAGASFHSGDPSS